MITFETEVLEIIPRVAGVKSFRFKLKQGTDFLPGQFFFVGIKNENRELTKHFSFSNAPTEKGYVEFTKRITQSEYSQALEELKIGDWAKLKMPYGDFTFSGEYEKIAFLSGGIGITPIRSIYKFIADKKLRTSAVLLYGNNKQEEIIFRQDFDQLAKENQNLRVVYTLTSPQADQGNWPGRTGYINEGMIKEEVPDFKQRVFYLCGPPAMVQVLTGILRDKLSVSPEQIRTENFTGY